MISPPTTKNPWVIEKPAVSCHAPRRAATRRFERDGSARASMHELEDPGGPSQIAPGDVGAALHEGDIASQAGDPRFAQHPLAGAPHIQEVDGQMHADGVAPAIRPAAAASSPSRKADSMPPWMSPSPLQWRRWAKKACSDPSASGR